MSVYTKNMDDIFLAEEFALLAFNGDKVNTDLIKEALKKAVAGTLNMKRHDERPKTIIFYCGDCKKDYKVKYDGTAVLKVSTRPSDSCVCLSKTPQVRRQARDELATVLLTKTPQQVHSAMFSVPRSQSQPPPITLKTLHNIAREVRGQGDLSSDPMADV